MYYWFVLAADHIFGTVYALLSFVVFAPLGLFRLVLQRRPAATVLAIVVLCVVSVAGFFVWERFWKYEWPGSGGRPSEWAAGEVSSYAVLNAAASTALELRLDPVTGCEFFVPEHGFGLVPRIGPNGRQICHGGSGMGR